MKLKIFTTALFIFTLSLVSHAQVLRDHIVLNLPFSNNTDDYSTFDNHAIIEGANNFPDRFSTINTAFYFDGVDDYIYIPNSSGFKPQLPLTFSMWIYAEEVSSNNNRLFTNDDNEDFYSGISAQIDPFGTGVITISYGTGGGSGSQHRRTAKGSNGPCTHCVGLS